MSGNGICCTPSSSGGPNSRAGRRASSACSMSPVQHHTTPHTWRMCSSGGNGSPGGTVRKAKKPFTSSGASAMNWS